MSSMSGCWPSRSCCSAASWRPIGKHWVSCGCRWPDAQGPAGSPDPGFSHLLYLSCSGRAVRGRRWSMAQESTSPMVRPAASCHQWRWAGSAQRQGQDEHLSGGLDPVAQGRGGGRFFSISPWKPPPPPLPAGPASASHSAVTQCRSPGSWCCSPCRFHSRSAAAGI